MQLNPGSCSPVARSQTNDRPQAGEARARLELSRSIWRALWTCEKCQIRASYFFH